MSIQQSVKDLLGKHEEIRKLSEELDKIIPVLLNKEIKYKDFDKTIIEFIEGYDVYLKSTYKDDEEDTYDDIIDLHELMEMLTK